MGVAVKNNVLIIPAWYPCSFFREQADILRDDYVISILYGTMHKMGIRKGLSAFFKNELSVKVQNHEDYAQVEFQYINHLYPIFERKQIDALTMQIGNVISSIYNGGKPDIIHIQSISDLAVFVVRWAKANNIKVVLTEHILFVRHEINRFAKMREQVYENVDKVLCVSNYVYRNLLTSGFKIKNAEVIGNLVNDTYLQCRNNIQKNGKILFVANHYHDKGLDVLIQVAKCLKEQMNVTIDIVGLSANSLYDANSTMERIINDNALEDVMCLLGHIEHQKLLTMYPNYSLLLSTSVSETFGLVVAESILYGTKVVCTDSGGIRDFVNERNGIVVGVNNIEGMVNAIQNLLENSMLPIQESELIAKRFGHQTFKKNMLNMYDSLIPI